MSTFEEVDLLTAPTAEMGIELARGASAGGHHHGHQPSGYEWNRRAPRVARGSETRDIPVIALTAAASERETERGTQAGFYRCPTKPLNVDEFLTALEALLTRSS